MFKCYINHIYIIEYQKCDLSHIHCLIFLHVNNNFLKYNIINDVIYAELFSVEINLNESFIKLIQDFITYDFCDFNHLNTFYMIKKIDDTDLYYIKKFLKSFYSDIVINKNEYLKYSVRESVSEVSSANNKQLMKALQQGL